MYHLWHRYKCLFFSSLLCQHCTPQILVMPIFRSEVITIISLDMNIAFHLPFFINSPPVATCGYYTSIINLQLMLQQGQFDMICHISMVPFVCYFLMTIRLLGLTIALLLCCTAQWIVDFFAVYSVASYFPRLSCPVNSSMVRWAVLNGLFVGTVVALTCISQFTSVFVVSLGFASMMPSATIVLLLILSILCLYIVHMYSLQHAKNRLSPDPNNIFKLKSWGTEQNVIRYVFKETQI